MTQVPTASRSSREALEEYYGDSPSLRPREPGPGEALEEYYGDSPPLRPREPDPGQGWGDASPSGALHAIGTRWWLVLLTMLVFAGPAVYVGVERKPTYTATASINVGEVDVRVQALGTFVSGASSLAASYSRIATSQKIVHPIAQRLGVSRADVAERLSATSVASSPIFEIRGTGKTANDSIRLTNAATEEMQRYVARRTSGEDAAAKLLKAYSVQARKAADLQRRYVRLRNLRERATSAAPLVKDEEQDVPTASQVTNALVAQKTAELQTQALGSQYQSRSTEAEMTTGVELLKRAFTAESDRQKVLQQLVAIAIGAGLVFGAALALLLGRRATRRKRLKAQRA